MSCNHPVSCIEIYYNDADNSIVRRCNKCGVSLSQTFVLGVSSYTVDKAEKDAQKEMAKANGQPSA